MKTVRIFILGILMVWARESSAHIIINEIAWMGTVTSANAEWIELYNPDNTTYVVNDWVLYARDGSPSIRLNGEIPANSYWVLERSSDATIPNVTANQIYTGSLGNTGEDIILTNENGEVVDEVNQQEGWEAGDNITKATMQRTKSGAWITSEGTPGEENSETGATELMSQTNTGNVSVESATTSETSKIQDSDIKKELIDPDPKFSAQVSIPSSIVAGSPISPKVLITHTGNRDFVTGRFDWYFGDGSTYQFFKNKEFTYTYIIPGEYTVVLEYFSNEMKETVDAIYKKKIKVISNNLTITINEDDTLITIENTAKEEIDLYGWQLKYGTQVTIFPKYTLIPGNSKKSFALSKLKLVPENIHSSELVDTTGTIIARYDTIQP